jgi:hypothetical protein
MRRTIRRAGEVWELAVGIDPLRGDSVRFERREDALGFLRHLAAEEGTAALRELLAGEWPGAGVHRMGDAEVLECLAGELAAGVVRAGLAPLPAPSRFVPGGGSAASSPSSPSSSPASSPPGSTSSASGPPASGSAGRAGTAAARPPTPREMEAAARASRPVRPAPAPPPRLDWIEIRLVGEDDRSIPGARYRVVLPDGTERSGRLDGQGLARLDRIPSGTCRVSFPELDRDAWTPL